MLVSLPYVALTKAKSGLWFLCALRLCSVSARDLAQYVSPVAGETGGKIRLCREHRNAIHTIERPHELLPRRIGLSLVR